MEEKDYYTTELQERIYHGTVDDDSKTLSHEMNLFLSSLIKRKRNDPYEGGLQATMVILPTSFGAKVTENDGRSVHERGFTNITKFLNGDKIFLTDEGIRRTYLYKEESYQRIREGIEVRFLDGEEELLVAITTHTREQTDFQKEIIKRLLFYVKQIKDRGFYPSLKVGLTTKTIKMNDFEEFNDELYQQMIDALNEQVKK